jgi:hypothetical protein
MPNQMIALQARNPQLPDPSRQTAQFANMMNMARQQEAAQRQSALAQQTMDINKAQEARAAALQGPALTKAQQDNIVQALGIFREAVGDIAEGDVAAAEAVRADLVSRVPGYDKFIPPASQWTGDTIRKLMLTSEKEIEKTIATPVASLELSTSGAPRSVTVGGLNPEQRPVYDAPETPVAPRATPTVPQPAPASPGSTGKFGEARFVPDEAVPLNAYQQEDLRNLQSELGMSDTPASFTRGGMGGAAQMTPDVMSRIVDSAFQTGVMAQVDFDQLLASQPPQNKQALVDSFRRANITLQADAPSLADSAMGANPVQTPESQFAVYRGEPMQQTLAQTRTSTPLQMRNPNQPIAPGSSVVPLGRLGAEKTTEAQATKNVELNMAPQIAAATKKAERAIELKSEAPKALSATKNVVNGLDDYIDTIDRLLRSPDRSSIVGRFEGRIPYVLQDERQAELQADFDKIKNTDTLTSLVEMKQASPTGGSPVGNASNQDVLLVARGANSLVQTGGVSKFDQELKNIRRQAYRARQTAIDEYNTRYGELAAADPRLKLKARPTADRYISSKDLQQNKTSTSAAKTPVIPDAAKQMLRKNPSPQQRAFFDRTFGAGAAAKVLGAR